MNIIHYFSDIHLSFYFELVKKYKQIPGIKSINNRISLCNQISYDALVHQYTDLATHYVDFIASLQNIGRKIVFAAYPSAVTTANIPYQLVKYGVVTKEDIILFPNDIWWEVANPLKRMERLNIFNSLLERACEVQNIEFYSVNNYILDDNNVIKSEFVDLSPCNIHLRWTPLLEIWISLLERSNIGISRENLVANIQELEEKYQNDKIENRISIFNSDNETDNNEFNKLIDYLKDKDEEYEENFRANIEKKNKKKRKKNII